LHDYDTDDENEDVEEFVEEDDVNELTNILKQSGLHEASEGVVDLKYKLLQEEPFMNPKQYDYLPEDCRKLILLLQLEKKRKDATQ